jgi:hypothetical protein
MSASHVALAVELPDFEAVYPIIEMGSPASRKTAFLAFVNEQFDTEYEDDLELEDISIEGGRLIVEYQSSTELCNEITHVLFEGLAEQEGRGMLAVEYNSRIGVYTCMVPGYDEAEYVDECFDDFDGLMHELEEFMDRRDQLLRVIELSESDPVKSRLREYLDEEGEEEEPEPGEDNAGEDVAESIDELPDDDPEPLSPMDELKQAMADGDEERVQELFARIQQK